MENWSAWKGKLNRAAKKSPADAIAACDAFDARCEELGTAPDWWSLSDRIRLDAQFAIMRAA